MRDSNSQAEASDLKSDVVANFTNPPSLSLTGTLFSTLIAETGATFDMLYALHSEIYTNTYYN